MLHCSCFTIKAHTPWSLKAEGSTSLDLLIIYLPFDFISAEKPQKCMVLMYVLINIAQYWNKLKRLKYFVENVKIRLKQQMGGAWLAPPAGLIWEAQPSRTYHEPANNSSSNPFFRKSLMISATFQIKILGWNQCNRIRNYYIELMINVSFHNRSRFYFFYCLHYDLPW